MVILGFWCVVRNRLWLGQRIYGLCRALCLTGNVILQSGAHHSNWSRHTVCCWSRMTDRLIEVLWMVSHPGCNWRLFKKNTLLLYPSSFLSPGLSPILTPCLFIQTHFLLLPSALIFSHATVGQRCQLSHLQVKGFRYHMAVWSVVNIICRPDYIDWTCEARSELCLKADDISFTRIDKLDVTLKTVNGTFSVFSNPMFHYNNHISYNS